ncbi:hypothetical protein FQN50_003248 [Emmonsiellopsis sp. PD_5]|nr:hypothetical protein FQN50_003248 [Emmonsiellopsis sp. PD_5]
MGSSLLGSDYALIRVLGKDATGATEPCAEVLEARSLDAVRVANLIALHERQDTRKAQAR